jgi:hypothetical protein
MVSIYIPLCKGLAQSKEALAILKACPFISGVETLNSAGELELFQKAGLKVSIHNPIKMVNCGLSDKRLISELRKEENSYMLDSITSEDAETAGFHTYNKTLPVFLHMVKNKPLPEWIYEKESLEQIRENTIKNLLFLESMINSKGSNKKILFETQPSTNYSKLKNPQNKVTEQEMIIMRKTGMMNTPEFIASILNDKRIKDNKSIGFLFDTAHILISVKTMIESKEINDDVDSYFSKIIKACKGRVFQLHIARPTIMAKGVYVDDQEALRKGDKMSQQVLIIAKKVLQANPDIKSVTLEIDTYLEPVEHAKKLVQQTEMVVKELNLKVEK